MSSPRFLPNHTRMGRKSKPCAAAVKGKGPIARAPRCRAFRTVRCLAVAAIDRESLFPRYQRTARNPSPGIAARLGGILVFASLFAGRSP
jgi:hypothetical protein